MIKACIFDLGGTIVDRYSMTSLLSLRKLFVNRAININNDLLLKGDGMNNQKHILNILNDKTILKKWFNRYKDYPDEYDVKVLLNELNQEQCAYSEKMIDILPETRECIDYLGFNYIKTGCTARFDKENMKAIQNKLDLPFKDVRRCLDKFKKHNMIVKTSGRGKNIPYVAKIVNYDKWQGDYTFKPHSNNIHKSFKSQHKNNYKNYNNGNNENIQNWIYHCEVCKKQEHTIIHNLAVDCCDLQMTRYSVEQAKHLLTK